MIQFPYGEMTDAKTSKSTPHHVNENNKIIQHNANIPASVHDSTFFREDHLGEDGVVI